MSGDKQKKSELNIAATGKRLKEIREILNLTIEKMHEITGYSKSMLSMVENGHKKPSSHYLFTLLERFNVNLNYVFNGKLPVFLKDSVRDRDDLAFEGTYDEFMYFMENVEMVRYAMLSHFLTYKVQHKEIIKEILEEKKQEEKKGED